MANKERLNEMLHIPVSKTMKREIERTAEAEERKVADMGRVLWREALEAREEKAVAPASK